ncbi:2,3-bisphosphoglycerate-dependent phosphoglycerate mutase-like protein [Tanacetum coccineum]
MTISCSERVLAREAVMSKNDFDGIEIIRVLARHLITVAAMADISGITMFSATLMLIRHGESLWNEKNMFTVCVDVPLTEKRVEEAVEACKRISNIPINMIYTSALIHAQMIAMLAMTKHRRKKVMDFNIAEKEEDISYYAGFVGDEVFNTWMAFGGNTRDLGSFGEETDEITNLHRILEEVLLTKRGDGVASIKQRRHDLFSDGV